ncbi:hypothetical protein [Castellaniella sp.]|uniref:hypothetical protein n=1 Tax=Castellaniella sp. TaxID=1955812 RepID=UPI002AFE423A|nr:hypothetical protein [Castellaniella sp.]
MNLDNINNAPSQAVADAVMGLLDRLQDHPKAVQSIAAAVLFLQVAKTHRFDPQHIFTVAGNMLSDTIHGERPQFRALRLYAESELK